MKLLFDENLSFRLVTVLADQFPGSAHVRDVGLLGASDDEVWRYARDHEFLLISKDTDFYQRCVLYGPPPKVIWLRIGNCSTSSIAKILRERYSHIEQFQNDDEAAILVLD